MKIAILGGGSWGAALAIHLAKNQNQVKVWEFFEEQAREMQEKRICRLLPDAPLPENIFVSWKMEEVLPQNEVVFIVVPSDKVELTLEKALPLMGNVPLVICSKGFASGMRLISEIVQEKSSFPVYCLYGPTHAEEVCRSLFSGIVLAGKESKSKLKKAIESKQLKVETSKDIIGVQVAAALKNILAVFIGVLDGAMLGDNAKAYVMTKGLEEIKEVGKKWGAKEKTFSGLAGMGDVIVTCTSQHSRNRHVGEQVGKGRKLEEVLAEMKMVAEGVTTAKYIPELKKRFNLKLPLLSGLHQILFEGKKVEEVLSAL